MGKLIDSFCGRRDKVHKLLIVTIEKTIGKHVDVPLYITIECLNFI